MVGWQLPPQGPTPAVVVSKISPKDLHPPVMADSIVLWLTALQRQISRCSGFLRFLPAGFTVGVQAVDEHLDHFGFDFTVIAANISARRKHMATTLQRLRHT